MYCTLISKPKPPLINFMATLLPVIVRKPIGNQVTCIKDKYYEGRYVKKLVITHVFGKV